MEEYDRTGKTIILIIANYTGDLPGYIKDIESIPNFFNSNVDDCDIRVHRDVDRETFLNVLTELQKELKSDDGKSVRGIFTFILSHGDENGIIVPKPESTDEDFDYVTTSEVLNPFTHDKVPNLTGKPKVFFFQACAGCKVGKLDDDSLQRPEVDDWDIKGDFITVGADVFVAHASYYGTISLVPDTGSWLIQTMCKVFEKYINEEDLVTMMLKVNKRISAKKRETIINGAEYVGNQMSVFTSMLTKKLFLSGPRVGSTRASVTKGEDCTTVQECSPAMLNE